MNIVRAGCNATLFSTIGPILNALLHLSISHHKVGVGGGQIGLQIYFGKGCRFGLFWGSVS